MLVMTTLQRALHSALAHVEPCHLDHEFFGHWREMGADRDGSIKDLVWRRCTQQDKPLQGLVWIGSTVQALDWLSARQQLREIAPVVELVELMTLVLWERRILDIAPPAQVGSSVPMLPLNAPLAASLIASAWLNVNVRIVLDGQGRLCVLNTLSDAKPSEWGNPTKAIRAEIGAFLHAYGHIGRAESYDAFRNAKRQRMRQMRNDPDSGVPSAELLRVRLEQHRQQGRLEPMVAAKSGAADGISRETCLWLRDELNIASFQMGSTDGQDGVDVDILDKLEDLKGEISDTLQEIFLKLHESSKDIDMKKAKVFISYAHADKEWLDKIKLFLGQLEDNGQLEIWEDTKIETGDDWRSEIENALSSCTIAVLLLSIHFARSKFIKDEEMPKIWKRHEQEGVQIYPVLVRNFPWEEDKNLAKIQIKMHDGKALNKLSEDECDDALTAIGREISQKLRAKQERA